MFNLLSNAWLPIRRQSGQRDIIRPAQIAEIEDPPIALDWPRADFRIASLEFLIGLLATACPPATHGDWLDGWEVPPAPAALDAAFAPLAHAFNLDGEGPRFLQDFENLVSGAEPIERLLIEAPGARTLKQNTDLMVRRNRITALGRATAAIVLHTFQSWAPEGGRGNLTGLRGGGPMVTLIQPGVRPSLWRQVWANIPLGQPPMAEDLPRVFPWLMPTVTSEGTRIVTPETSHPLQAWWGMARRIRLDFVANDTGGSCDLTGEHDAVRVVSWRQRPHGAKYMAWGSMHPLTPHRRQKAGTDLLPLHPQPGRVGYHDWLGIVLRTRDASLLPAASVEVWRNDRERDADAGRTRLLAAGYDMKSMKARAFVEAEMPLPPASPGRDQWAERLVLSANQVAGLLRSAVRYALFSAVATVKLDAEMLSTLRERLWEQTESEFFALLTALPENLAQLWLLKLRGKALALFDEAAPLTPENGGAAPRIGRARRNLVFALTGFGKEGAALFTTLELAVAAPKAKKGKAA